MSKSLYYSKLFSLGLVVFFENSVFAEQNRQKQEASFSTSIGINQEQYTDVKSPDWTGGKFVVLNYGNQPFLAYQTKDAIIYDASLIGQHEQNAEIYDSNRDQISPRIELDLKAPIVYDKKDGTLSFVTHIDALENAPQLTDFEARAQAGLQFTQMYQIEDIVIQPELTVSGMYSDHVDDDERPREKMGYDRELLSRSGYGPSVRAAVDVYFNDQTKLRVSAEKYQSAGGYDPGQKYQRTDYSVELSRALNAKTICSLALKLVERKKEREYFDIDDRLLTTAAQCKRLF